MAAGKRMTADKAVENGKAVNSTTKAEKQKETANTEATEGRFIYIGPTTGTGLVENAIFSGSRESVEEHLKDTLEKIPQVRLLIVETKSLAANKAKVRKAGTLLNKYYNDVLSLQSKRKEG
jgi:sorbitol-specific phosphotransferase system component IIBC